MQTAVQNHVTGRQIAEKAFLGPEFLTWLYFTLLEKQFELSLPKIGEVQFGIGKRCALQALDATGARVVLAGTGLADCGEVLQAVQRGALIEHLSLEISLGNRVYLATVNGQDGGVSNVKLPDLFSKDEGEEDEEEGSKKKRKRVVPMLEDVLALRAKALDDLENVLDALYDLFLSRRLARQWQKEDVLTIKRQIAKGLKIRIINVD